MRKNVTIFGVETSSSAHIDNKKKDILILGFGPKQGLDDTMLTAEAQYLINFSRSNRKSCLSLHYNGNSYNNTTAIATIATVFYLLMLQIYIYQFKAKDSEKKIYTLCLGNISGDFSANNMKKNRIKWVCIWFFC